MSLLCPSALDERRLEAVYLSFAMFGEWNADKLKALPTNVVCKGLDLKGFLNLCKHVGLLPSASPGRHGTVVNIFLAMAAKVGLYALLVAPRSGTRVCTSLSAWCGKLPCCPRQT